MGQTTYSIQIFSLFGAGYVPEQRSDDTQNYLAPSDIDEATTSLTGGLLSEVLQSLRSALSINSGPTE